MSKNCVQQAFNSVGIDMFSGLTADEARRASQEIEALTGMMNKKAKDMTIEEKKLLSESIRGAMVDRIDTQIKMKQINAEAAKFEGEDIFNNFYDTLISGGDVSGVYQQTQAINADLVTNFTTALGKNKDAEKVWEKMGSIIGGRKVNEEVSKGIHMLSYGSKADDLLKAGINKDLIKGIQGIHEAITGVQKKKGYKMKNAGIRQGYIDGYLFKQSYSAQKVRDFGKDAFIKHLEENVDTAKMFKGTKLEGAEGAASRATTFGSIWESITTKQSTISDDPVASALRGLSQSREVIWKDGISAHDAMNLFSLETNLQSKLSSDFQNSAQKISVRSTLGAHPNTIIESFNKTAADLSFKKGTLTESQVSNMMARTKTLAAMVTQSNTYDQGTTSSLIQMLKAGQMLKLGATAITQVPMDMVPAMRTAMAQTNNLNAFAKMASLASTWTKTFANFSSDEIVQALGVMQDMGTMGMLSRYDLDMSVHSRAGRASNYVQHGVSKFIRSTGMEALTNFNRATTAIETMSTIADALGSMANKFAGEPAHLEKAYRDILETGMRLTVAEVDIIGKNISKLNGFGDGKLKHLDSVFNVDNVFKLDDELFAPGITDLMNKVDSFKGSPEDLAVLKGQLSSKRAVSSRMKDKIHTKMKGYIVGQMNKGVPVPNPRYSLKQLIQKPGSHVTTGQQALGMLLMFKDTIAGITANTYKDFSKIAAARGYDGAAVAAGGMVVASSAYFLGLDAISSALLNKEAAYQKVADGRYGEAVSGYLNKASAAPMVTDPILKFMYGGAAASTIVTDFMGGPIGGMGNELFKTLGSENKLPNLGKFMLRNMGLNHWVLDGASRQLGYDIKNAKKLKKETSFRQ